MGTRIKSLRAKYRTKGSNDWPLHLAGGRLLIDGVETSYSDFRRYINTAIKYAIQDGLSKGKTKGTATSDIGTKVRWEFIKSETKKLPHQGAKLQPPREGGQADVMDYLATNYPRNWRNLVQTIKREDLWRRFLLASGMINIRALEAWLQSVGVEGAGESFG